MKFLVSWTARNSGTSESDLARSFAVFSKWSPSPGSTIQQFVQRIDGEGGFAFVETDDSADILRDVSKFSPWFKYEVFPVLDMVEGAAIEGEAIEYRGSIS